MSYCYAYELVRGYFRVRVVIMAKFYFIIAAILAAALSGPAHAYTGLELKDACNNESTWCTDYVGVISDSMIRSADPRYCLPFTPTTAYQQLREAVTKYLNAHPEELHRSAAAVTTDALHEAFPCKEFE